MRPRSHIFLTVFLAIATPVSAGVKLGINLDRVNYYQQDMKFTDLMHPLTRSVNTARYVQYGTAFDADGWPTKLPADWHGWPQYIPAIEGGLVPGTYRITATGKGEVVFRKTKVFTGAPGESLDVDVSWTPEAKGTGDLLTITKTDPADHLRDVRLYRIDRDPDACEGFNPDYLASLQGFKILRDAIWTEVQGSRRSAWTAADEAKYTLLFKLCNLIDADPWLCIPHKADDNYLASLGRLAKRMFGPLRKVYVERSVEVWNYAYPWGVETGDTEAWGKTQTPVLEYSMANAVLSGIMWDKIEAAFGRPIVRVFSGQCAWPDRTGWGLAEAKKRGIRIDVLGVAPYFDASGVDVNALRTFWKAGQKDEALAAILDKIEAAIPAEEGHLQKNLAIAKQYGISLRAYECGQGIQLPGDLADLVNAAQVHPRMPKMMATYFAMLEKYLDSGNYYCHVGQWANGQAWGLEPYLGAGSPKLDFVRSYMTPTSPPTIFNWQLKTDFSDPRKPVITVTPSP